MMKKQEGLFFYDKDVITLLNSIKGKSFWEDVNKKINFYDYCI